MNVYERTIHNMTNHTPSQGDIDKIEAIRGEFMDLATFVLDRCPRATREASLGLTALEESLMWFVASIARNGDGAAT